MALRVSVSRLDRVLPMPRRRKRRAASPRITLSLALQGGGAHGAFTWGVLDRLLEEDWLEIDGLSGASAGALNAACLASGWLEGGRRGGGLAAKVGDLNLHLLDGGAAMRVFDVSSKQRADWGFFQDLKAIGREAATAWLGRHKSALGAHSSIALPGA